MNGVMCSICGIPYVVAHCMNAAFSCESTKDRTNTLRTQLPRHVFSRARGLLLLLYKTGQFPSSERGLLLTNTPSDHIPIPHPTPSKPFNMSDFIGADTYNIVSVRDPKFQLDLEQGKKADGTQVQV